MPRMAANRQPFQISIYNNITGLRWLRKCFRSRERRAYLGLGSWAGGEGTSNRISQGSVLHRHALGKSTPAAQNSSFTCTAIIRGLLSPPSPTPSKPVGGDVVYVKGPKSRLRKGLSRNAGQHQAWEAKVRMIEDIEELCLQPPVVRTIEPPLRICGFPYLTVRRAAVRKITDKNASGMRKHFSIT